MRFVFSGWSVGSFCVNMLSYDVMVCFYDGFGDVGIGCGDGVSGVICDNKRLSYSFG